MSRSAYKVYVAVRDDYGVADMFRSHGHNIVGRMSDADVVVFTGGGDLNPGLYGENCTHSYPGSNARDKAEVAAYDEALDLNKFKFGICRGGQLLNVLNGGRLWQHIEGGHGRHHPILDLKTQREVITSSVHHQQFRPTQAAELIATCNLSTRKFAEHDQWVRGVSDYDDIDVEACWYKDTKSLCVQGHPEFGPNEFTEYCFELIERYI